LKVRTKKREVRKGGASLRARLLAHDIGGERHKIALNAPYNRPRPRFKGKLGGEKKKKAD